MLKKEGIFRFVMTTIAIVTFCTILSFGCVNAAGGNLAYNKTVQNSPSVEASWGWGWNPADVLHYQGIGWHTWTNNSVDVEKWITIDLAQEYSSVQRVVIYPRQDSDSAGTISQFPQQFIIMVSSNNSTWTTVVTQTNYTLTDKSPQTFTFTPTSARYVKIEALNRAAEICFSQIEVYQSLETTNTFSTSVSTNVPTDINGWTNVAYGKPALSYFPLVNGEMSSTVDNIYSNYAQIYQPSGYGWRFGVDLQGSVVINSIGITCNNAVKQMYIWVLTDNNIWQRLEGVCSPSTTGGNTYYFTLATPVNAKEIELRMDVDWWASITEIVVYKWNPINFKNGVGDYITNKNALPTLQTGNAVITGDNASLQNATIAAALYKADELLGVQIIPMSALTGTTMGTSKQYIAPVDFTKTYSDATSFKVMVLDNLTSITPLYNALSIN